MTAYIPPKNIFKKVSFRKFVAIYRQLDEQSKEHHAFRLRRISGRPPYTPPSSYWQIVYLLQRKRERRKTRIKGRKEAIFRSLVRRKEGAHFTIVKKPWSPLLFFIHELFLFSSRPFSFLSTCFFYLAHAFVIMRSERPLEPTAVLPVPINIFPPFQVN